MYAHLICLPHEHGQQGRLWLVPDRDYRAATLAGQHKLFHRPYAHMTHAMTDDVTHAMTGYPPFTGERAERLPIQIPFWEIPANDSSTQSRVVGGDPGGRLLFIL